MSSLKLSCLFLQVSLVCLNFLEKVEVEVLKEKEEAEEEELMTISKAMMVEEASLISILNFCFL